MQSWGGILDWNEYYSQNGSWIKYCFSGMFSEYDWTEFAFYVGGAIFIYLLIRVSKQKEEIENKASAGDDASKF